ncbi:MAG: hypothetical protein IPN79_10345 [Saprospiraceae bacterium]|nr:hypothetical protein [Saprospiraceae bacterium]
MYILFILQVRLRAISVKDNNILNVTGRGSVTHPASVIKHRWSDKLYMENNIVKMEKSALVKIGALKSENDDLSKLTGNQFYCDFFQIGGQKDFTKIFHVKNNTFVFPVMNKSTEIYDIADFRFENNKIVIEYFGPSMIPSSVSQDNSFFLGRQRLDRKTSAPAGDFISTGNSISIVKTGNGILKYADFPDGVQINQNDIPDKNYNYKKVIIKDTFNLTSTGLEMFLPDAEIHEYKPIIHGKENAFYLHDFANANHLRPNGKSIESDIRIDHAVWKKDKSPFVFLPDSKQKLTVNKHSGDKIQVLNYIYFQSLFNMAKEEDLTLKLSFSAKDKKGKQFQAEYYIHLHQKGRTILFETENGSFDEVFPADASGRNLAVSPEVILKSDIKSKPVLVLERGDKHLKEASFVLKNCEEIENYVLTCNVFKSGFKKLTEKP